MPGVRPPSPKTMLWVIRSPMGTAEEVVFDPAPAPSALWALYEVHHDALGGNLVRLIDGRIRFLTAADREICSGVWEVTRLGGETTVFCISAVDPLDHVSGEAPAAA